MKFLANENFPLASAIALAEKGFDVISISQITPGISDTEVLRKAINEERIILTFDSDYGNLIFKLKLGKPLSVIYFRFRPVNPLEPLKVFDELILKSKVELEGWFIVLDREGLRKRRM